MRRFAVLQRSAAVYELNLLEVSEILSLKNLVLSRDGKKILRGISLEVGDREIHSIIGSNGAGKSTLA